MNTAQELFHAIEKMDNHPDGYFPYGAAREAARYAGGIVMKSSNDSGDYSHSPTLIYKFEDGSTLHVAYWEVSL